MIFFFLNKLEHLLRTLDQNAVGRKVGAIFVSQGLLMDYVYNTGWQLLLLTLEYGRTMAIIKCCQYLIIAV